MTFEVDLKDIANLLSALNEKIDVLLENRDTLSFMVLAERSLRDFLGNEPDIYSIRYQAKVNCH